MEKLTVLVKKASDMEFTKAELEGESTYHILKSAVGGYIEHIGFRNGIDLWLNEEGKLISLPFNTALMGADGKIFDIVVGDIVITSSNEEGDTISLTDEQIEYFNENILDTKMLITEQGMLPVLNFK